MSYFVQFPVVKYPAFEDKQNFNYLTNIAFRIVNKTNIVDDRSAFYEYTLLDGEKIENLSFSYYGSVEYYWTILLINNIFDINYDLPLSQLDFADYIVEKYGSYAAAASEIHYFIRVHECEMSFIEVPQDIYDTYPEFSVDLTVPDECRGQQMRYTKTAYVIEEELNEAKRSIKLIRKEYIQDFVSAFMEETK